MYAAVIHAAGEVPIYSQFREPAASDGTLVLEMLASALSGFSRSRSSGTHYSAQRGFPAVAGAEGVGRAADGQRLYFALPEAPFGALAERTLVRAEHCVPVPDDLSDMAAAALANPGMSAWAALLERAQLKRGETVLINGATGAAGGIAVQLAKFLGAGRVIATGRNAAALQALLQQGADAVIALNFNHSEGEQAFGEALAAEFERGIDVVVDYLWGRSALAIMGAVARTVEDGHPVRFVQVGEASREHDLLLPGAALRSSALLLMGSGIKSVPFPRLLEAVQHVFEVAGPAGLSVDTRTVPFSQVEQTWASPGSTRLVYVPDATCPHTRLV